MEYALIITILILFIVIFIQRSKIAGISKTIKYTEVKLNEIMTNNTQERIKVFTSNKEIKELLITINKLLDYNNENVIKYNKANISMKKMLSNISHDLKTPLTVILGYAEILQLKNTERVMVNKIYNKTKEVIELINRFFDLSKLESGDKKIEITKINICEICRTTILSFYDKLNNDVSINVKKGEIYGLLGPNGAGKTTLMRIITGLVKPTTGYVEVFGETMNINSYDILKRMGSIIEYPTFYDNLTAKENLELHCGYMGYHNTEEIEKVLRLLKLYGTSGKTVKEFSLGIKQRLGIARAIVTKPELLILDEPINGLDPEGIRELRDILKVLCKEYGITILISSHILSEIEQMADTIGIISKGKLINEISMSNIKKLNTQYIEIEIDNCKKAACVLENDLGIKNFKVMDEYKIRIYDCNTLKNEISRALIMKDVEIIAMTRKNFSLEDYFLKLVKEVGINA